MAGTQAMFGALPRAPAGQDGQGVKRRAVDASADGNETVMGLRKQQEILMAVSKGLLQVTEDQRHRSREENLVLKAKADNPFCLGMDESIEAYDKVGKTARESDSFKGHPGGKRPDALFRALLVRVLQVMQLHKTEIETKLQSMPEVESGALQAALKTIELNAHMASQENCCIKATRCFKVVIGKSDDAEDLEAEVIHKWIFFSAVETDLMQAFRLLRKCSFFQVFGLSVEEDGAPRSGFTKKLHQLIYGGNGARGKNGGKKKN
mmetsp:Transcript_86446/g.185285  ORF Transcript_86446/g.185285 Transcript_86446/m.185285 type:complete len:264 (-) Transcript_86446:15-806(-)